MCTAMNETTDPQPAPVAAMVIPCSRVGDRILDMQGGMGEDAARVFVIDDVGPEKSGERVGSRLC